METRKVVYIYENAKEGIGTIWLEDKLVDHVYYKVATRIIEFGE